MINFRITDIQGGMLTIERPAGQAISLKLAEIVEAQVMEILPSGAVSLKVKGDQLIAKTQVPLQQGQTAFFKVTGLPIDGKDLMLQFIGFSKEEQVTDENFMSSQSSLSNKTPLMPLLKELQSLIEQLKSLKPEQISQSNKNIRLQELNAEILKGLPTDVQRLPKEIRLQIQQLLQDSLRLTGQSIQSKLTDLLKNINPEIIQTKGFENIKKELSLNIEQILSSSFKGAIQDTGVALEAKLKNLAQVNGMTFFDDLKKATENPVVKEQDPDSLQRFPLNESKDNNKILQRDNTLEGQKTIPKTQTLSNDLPQLNNDLKARLLQIRQDMQEQRDKIEELIPQAKNNKSELAQISAKISSIDSSLNKIDNLIKDIETFQALSKATNSFYTFLPIQWDNLKEGDISFKKGKRGNLQSYSCTINLDLKEHGQLGIIVMQYGKDFYISMRAENKAFQEKLVSNIKELNDAFHSKGMNLKSAKVFDFDKKDEFEMIEELSLDHKGVNISI
ncbi:MAG: flagellar hook-length control protein FliK [Thermodesulfovibrionales bacterium]|nr:flagellar hook-length control protein FliK [Thermodesulfovibrionales bacterium]